MTITFVETGYLEDPYLEQQYLTQNVLGYMGNQAEFVINSEPATGMQVEILIVDREHATGQQAEIQIDSDNPLCVHCIEHKRITPANTLDHITPIRLGGAPLDRNNLQWLCERCHARKSQSERGKQ